MTAGIATGHPATTAIGARVLADGGSAADAAVAAVLAACVAETVLTGLGGAGFATYFEASTGSVTCLDFFCTLPGLGSDRIAEPMTEVDISFGGIPLPFSIGGPTVAVPGLPAGVETLHQCWGRLPWQRVVAPAVTLASTGVDMPAEHAATLEALAPAMLCGEGVTAYTRHGRLLRRGDRLRHRGLAATMAALAEGGAAAFYTGQIGRSIVATVEAAGGVLNATDLAAYRVLRQPVESGALGRYQVLGRADLSRTVATVAAVSANLAGANRQRRSVAMAEAIVSFGPTRAGCTTNVSVVDRDGNACVVTTSLGVGSGVWVPGTGIHLNSMLGEAELECPELVAGQRMPSNMCPLVVTDRGRLVLAAGAAGSSRIRSALLQVLVNALVDEADLETAIGMPRFHVAEAPNGPAVVHAEAGFPAPELAALREAGYRIKQWAGTSHYFGVASAVGTVAGRPDAAGDPRRGGVGTLVPDPADGQEPHVHRQRTTRQRTGRARQRPQQLTMATETTQ